VATEQLTDTRRHILAAADQIMRERGLRAATTRAIAERAGCAEGSIYRYFPDKHALLAECIRARYPEFQELLDTLPSRVGRGSIRKNLEEIARSALAFYHAILPMIAATMAEPELVEQQRAHYQKVEGGPLKTFGSVTAYVRSEQRIGRISSRVPPEFVARTLLGTCFAQAFVEAMVGEDARLGSDDAFTREAVRTLMEGLLVRRTAGM